VRPRIQMRGRRGRRAHAALGLLGVVLALILGAAASGPSSTPRALGASQPEEVTPQTDAAIPAQEVLMLGSSPEEAPDETWGIGKVGGESQSGWTIVRYTAGEGWTLGPPILDGSGSALSGFAPVASELAGSIRYHRVGLSPTVIR